MLHCKRINSGEAKNPGLINTDTSRVQHFTPSKNDNLCCILEEENDVFLFDVPKSREAIPLLCEFSEEIKNGEMISGKHVPVGKHPNLPTSHSFSRIAHPTLPNSHTTDTRLTTR